MNRRSILAYSLLALTGCTTVPPQTTAGTADAPAGWHVIQPRQRFEPPALAAAAGRLAERVGVGEITIEHAAASPADDADLEDLRSALAEQLRHALSPADTAVITLNVRLREATPVSPVANAITGALLFIPLDTGSIVVESELRSLDGELIATRRERLHGDYLDIAASLSRWGRVRNALGKWAQRCLEETAPAIAASSNVS